METSGVDDAFVENGVAPNIADVAKSITRTKQDNFIFDNIPLSPMVLFRLQI